MSVSSPAANAQGDLREEPTAAIVAVALLATAATTSIMSTFPYLSGPAQSELHLSVDTFYSIMAVMPAAARAVREGFSKGDRGKLIMACGTGKTLTSLRIAEDRVPVGGRVLFLVPSISLLAQTLREWTGDATADYHATMADDAELYRRRYAEMAAGRRSHRRPNVKDVAAIAEVAVGTASDALNGKGRVNPATRYRIRSVAEAIGYFPNATARSLKRSRNGVIGLCIRPFGGAPLQYISVSYYARFLNAAAAAALERKYALAILPPDISTELDDIALDGVIVADPPPGDPLIEELRNRSVPYVTDFGEVDDPTSLCVGNDQAQAVRSVCDHFKSQGARSVAILAADGDEDYTIRSLRGYEQWCAENKQSPRIERTNILDPVATAAAAQRLMVGPDRPDAIYTTEAPVGNYLVTAARAARLNTPEDLLLAYCAEHTMDPTLDDISMLSLHAEEIAQEAVDLLASTIEGQDPKPRHRVIGTTLHIRSSSLRQGVPPGSA